MQVEELQGLIKRINTILGPWCQKPGGVFYSGRSTLREGRFYLMGLNPGGDPKTIPTPIGDDLQAWLDGPEEDYSAYDEDWSDKKREYGKDGAPHQRGVRDICAKLTGEDERPARKVFCTNAIFVRSRTENDLTADVDLQERCWDVHKMLLDIVKPELIVCLGNGQKRSSFSILKGWLGAENVHHEQGSSSFRDGKWFDTTIPLDNNKALECRVLGVPHPSRFNPLRSEIICGFLAKEADRPRRSERQ